MSCDAQRSGNAWTIVEFSFLDENFGVLGAKDSQQVNSSGDFRNYRFSAVAPTEATYALALLYSEDDTRVDDCRLVEGQDTAPTPTPTPTPVDPPDPVGANLLSNGGFEDSLNNWSSCAAADLLSSSSDADSGNASLAINGGGCIYQEFPVTPGVAYSMKCRAKSSGGSLYTSASLSMLDSNYGSLDNQELPVESTEFEDYTASATASDNSVFGTVVLYSENPGIFDTCEVQAAQ